MTLQLRAPSGIYAGPVVVGQEKSGKRALLGVKAGAKLGQIKVKGPQGYAKLPEKLAKKWLDRSRFARAKKGAPIGAGNFGRVHSKDTNGGAPGDLDLDGIPNRLDVDDNGNLILDNLDPSTAGRARASQTESQFFIGVNLPAPLWDNMNANASAIIDAQIDRTLSMWQFIGIGILPGNPELDCGGTADPANPQGWIGGLSYCRRGGTGENSVSTGPTTPPTLQPFPACCDGDGDGFGEMVTVNIPGFAPILSLIPRASSSQIGTGDLLIQRVTSNGVTTDTPTMLPFVFDTVPTIVSYDDAQGNSMTPKYPLSPSGPGTMGNDFPVAAGPTGDVALKLTFWRPQRKPIPPEPGDWTDIGKLKYLARVQTSGGRVPRG